MIKYITWAWTSRLTQHLVSVSVSDMLYQPRHINEPVTLFLNFLLVLRVTKSVFFVVSQSVIIVKKILWLLVMCCDKTISACLIRSVLLYIMGPPASSYTFSQLFSSVVLDIVWERKSFDSQQPQKNPIMSLKDLSLSCLVKQSDKVPAHLPLYFFIRLGQNARSLHPQIHTPCRVFLCIYK